MLEKLCRWLAEFHDDLGRATVIRYGGGAFISGLPQRLEQDLPASPRNGLRPHGRAGISSIDRLVRHLDGG